MTETWASVAAPSRRWERIAQAVGWPLALRMAAVAEIGAGARVLDVGCGIGDPTLQAAVLTGPHGRVLGIDVDAEAVNTARDRAAALGLAHVEFAVADVRTHPVEAEAFDVVLSRWSIAFLDEAADVLATMQRALAAGGRIAIAGWAPSDANPWITVPADVVADVTGRPRISLEASDGFRAAADGALARLLVGAGFQAVGQERVLLSFAADDVESFWDVVTAVGPLGAAAFRLAEEERAAVLAELAARLRRYETAGVLRVPAQAQLAWGRA